MKTKTSATSVILAIFLAIVCAYLSACSAVSRANWKSFAVKTIGSIAVNTLSNLAQQEMTGGKADYGHALAGSLWTNMHATVSGDELYALLDADSGGQLPVTTKAAVNQIVRAATLSTPESRAAAFDAVAKTISEVSTKAGGLRHD